MTAWAGASGAHVGFPKRLRLGDVVTSTAFRSCVVLLEDLVLRGLRALRPGQPPKYYVCVLRSPLPGEVPLGVGAAACARLLAGAVADLEAPLAGSPATDGSGQPVTEFAAQAAARPATPLGCGLDAVEPTGRALSLIHI